MQLKMQLRMQLRMKIKKKKKLEDKEVNEDEEVGGVNESFEDDL